MGPKRRLVVLLASVSLLAAIFPAATGAAQVIPTSYPRSETLYTGGTMWGPPTDFNPVAAGYVTGTLGLLYETLFLYNPINDKFTPWLAQSGSWTGAKEYTLKLRSGLTWSDGQALTADDVVYTVNLGKLSSVPYSTLLNFLQSATKVDALTVKFTFSKALYQEWSNSLYTVAIVPAHLWGTRTAETDVLTFNTSPHPRSRGSGAYQLLTYDHDEGRLGQERRLVGQVAPGPGRQAQVRHRPRQHQQQRRARPDDGGPVRPQQQLPARASPASSHGGYGIHDLLSEGAVHARGQHRVAGDE